ncbi:hypothetical protein HVPorG_05020 [Roseomonas mucosa]|nr:hypothetical protein HVPorG_05020 [Roseomonas mucosa]
MLANEALNLLASGHGALLKGGAAHLAFRLGLDTEFFKKGLGASTTANCSENLRETFRCGFPFLRHSGRLPAGLSLT